MVVPITQRGQQDQNGAGRNDRRKLTLSQDPRKVGDSGEKNLEPAIGREIKALRLQQGITIAELSALTGLLISMLSKIKFGATSPSLTTLQALADALSIPITFFLPLQGDPKCAANCAAKV